MSSLTPTITPSGRIFITGATGFVGGALRNELSGHRLRLLVRPGSVHSGLKSANVEIVTGDVEDAASLAGSMRDCDTVIHLVAIIREEQGQTFESNIHQGTVNVVAEAKRAGVTRFLQMSAMGAMNNPAYPYMIAKYRAEEAVKASGLAWSIFRPSVIFGAGDEFINQLADLIRVFPVIPVVGSGKSKFQPVSAGDVAAAFARAINDPLTVGQTYDLGGPEIHTYTALLDIIAEKLGTSKPKVRVPVALMKPVVKLSKPLPKALRPPVTEEQLNMLALDNCSHQSATAQLIGRKPLDLRQGIDYILPR